jgi:hypothetical protein
VERLDPAKQLKEAGYPFDHIGRELIDLQGKWEVVSSDVLLLKGAIKEETQKLSDKVDDSQKTVLEKVENLFDRKFYQSIAAIIACLSIMFGVITFLRDHGVNGTALGWVAIVGGLGIFLVIYLVSRRSSTKPSTQPRISN